MLRVTSLLVLLALVGLVVAQTRCPNNCNSPNGYCLSTGVCQCSGNYKGVDCSVADVPISLGSTVQGTVSQGSFKYYHYTAAAGTQVRITMTVNVPPSSTNADADLYVKQGTQLPSRSDYNWAHMGTQRVSVLDIPAQSTAATYTIGVYGYNTVASYTLQVNRAGSNCPGDCTNHGTCNQATATCTCNLGWYGRACNETVGAAPNGQVVEHLNRGQWKYYYVTIPEGTTSLQVLVEQTSVTGDVDLYIRRNGVPSFGTFDFADSSTNRRFNITIPSPIVRSSYYLGFYGYFETNFKWQATLGSSTRNCLNQCSGPTHGTCTSGVCRCAPGFSGASCAQMTTDLTVYPPQPVSGHVDANEWNFYSVTPHTSSPLTINVTHLSGQDCDVYVQRDRNPTRFDFLYRDITYDPVTTLTISNPLDASWKIGVMGYAACDYSIVASVGAIGGTCPAQCTNNGGRCVPNNPNVCICPDNRAGQYCQYPVTRITSAQSITGSLAPNQWAYYRYDGPASAFSIVLHEDLPSHQAGVLWLYAAVIQAPTLSNYDWSDTATSTNTHRINVEIGGFIPNTHYYIGVYASPFAINSQNPYKISTWAAPFKK